MSLQVWLPLNGNINNQGLSNISISGSPASYSDGKIGKCAKITSYIDTGLPWDKWDFGTNSVSFGGWFKFNKSEISSIVTGYSYNSTYPYPTGGLCGNYSYGGMGLVWNGNNMINTSFNTMTVFAHIRCSSGIWNTSEYTVPFDTWVHYFCTFNKSTKILSLYINGNLFSQVSTGSFDNTTFTHRDFLINVNSVYGGNGPSYYIPMYTNDVRIYDHCLSAKEVKEISKGLCLHYKLNSANTYKNLVYNNTYNIYNNFGVTASLTKLNERFNGADVYRLTMTPTSDQVNSFKSELWAHGIYNFSRTFKAYTKYAFWIYYRPVTHSDIRVGGTASNIGGWEEIPPKQFNSEWFRVGQKRTGTATEDKSDSIFVSFYTPTATTGQAISIDFCAPCLLEGMDFIPSSFVENSLTSPNIEYDCSGYNNNGSISSTISLDASSSRYSNSNLFNNNSQYITLPAINTSGFANSFTFSWWSKTSSMDGKMAWGCGNGNRLNLYPTGSIFCMNTGDSAENPFKNNGTSVSSSSWQDNNWHHYAIVGNGSTNILYIDGIERGRSTTYKSLTGTQIYISGWDTGTSYKWNGNLSDFRIYATALSAEDIKELYQVSASIDKNGNLFCGEVIEE